MAHLALLGVTKERVYHLTAHGLCLYSFPAPAPPA
jgi:hypothetical protein